MDARCNTAYLYGIFSGVYEVALRKFLFCFIDVAHMHLEGGFSEINPSDVSSDKSPLLEQCRL